MGEMLFGTQRIFVAGKLRVATWEQLAARLSGFPGGPTTSNNIQGAQWAPSEPQKQLSIALKINWRQNRARASSFPTSDTLRSLFEPMWINLGVLDMKKTENHRVRTSSPGNCETIWWLFAYWFALWPDRNRSRSTRSISLTLGHTQQNKWALNH